MTTPGENEYLLSALPALGELGQAPPITSVDLLAHVQPFARPHAIIQAVLLSDDLLQRQAVLAGEIDEPSPAVLSAEQLREEAPLPDYLLALPAHETATHVMGDDQLWEAYFRCVAKVAAECRCRFLAEWVGFEVGLRNALAESRARALDLNVEGYLVATDLASDTDTFVDVLNEWSTAATPLAGLRVLDQARWAWLEDHDAWFTFRDDELAAYAVRLMLLTRWHRLREPEHNTSAAEHAEPTQA